ncbi:MAG: beta-propeller domain-containing protein [Eubacterium sp.]|nr:beta-propeller domain-containing protein [Eubacterium sp.]
MERNNMNDFEFVKDKFEKTYPATPESLSEEAINQLLLSKQEPKVIKLKPRYNVKAIVSAAAGLILFLGIMYAAYVGGLFSGNSNKVGNYYNEVNISSTFSESVDSNSSNEDYEALYLMIDRMGWDPMVEAGAGGFEIQTSDKAENVQEPDEIKIDGEYVYRLYNYTPYDDSGRAEKEQNRVYIYKINKDKAELISVINYEVDTQGEEYSDSFSAWMSDLYVYNDRLVVEIGIEDRDSSLEYERDFKKTVTQIYDISDRSAPKLISEFEQSGRKVSSQMIGNYLYTVSYYYASKEKGKHTIPSCGKLNNAVSVPADNISVFEDSNVSHFAVITAIDVEKAEKVSDSKAVLGTIANVYFSEQNLYIFGLKSYYGDDLDIIKAELNEGNIEFTEKSIINGRFNDFIELLEVNDLLIILERDYYDTDNIFVLNEKLEVIGKTKSFSGREQIICASFADDAMYISTYIPTYSDEYSNEYKFRVIDFSDPQNPAEKCTMDSDLWIELIIPVNENQVLCLGKNEGLDASAIILYDVSDKSAPKLLDYKEFYDVGLIFDNYVVNAEKGYISVSCIYRNEDEEKSGALTIEIVNDKIEITNHFVNEINFIERRWICIGDYLYCFEINNDAPLNETIVISSHKYE